MPATSPTLSPTLSAITAGFRGSSSGMPLLDLAHKVSADVGGLGIDTSADTGEQRDRAGAETEAGDVEHVSIEKEIEDRHAKQG